MKGYTDLEQSRKLAEILPLESADMGYNGVENRDIGKFRYDNIATTMPNMDSIPCWSLAALLSVLPEGYSSVLTRSFNGKDYYCKLDDKPIEIMADNPVDACYEMILKLNELNLL